MAAKPRKKQGAGAKTKAAVSRGDRVRDQVRDLTVSALRQREVRSGQISDLVHEVLEGATQGLEDSVPSSRRSVLRQVFAGLSDAVETVSAAGVSAGRELRQRGSAVGKREMEDASRRLRAANAEFLHATGAFAKRVSGEAREELESLVRRSKRAGAAAGESAHEAARAADGRLLELTGEAARAGVDVVRRAAQGVALAAGGFLEGLAEVAKPRGAGTVRRPTARAKSGGSAHSRKKPPSGGRKKS